MAAGDRVHRVAELPEPVDVAADGARGGTQPGRQFVPAPARPGRQQREQREQPEQPEQPPGGIGHLPIMPCSCVPVLSWMLPRVGLGGESRAGT